MSYLRKPFIIPVFIPHIGCPNKCVFCDQVGITGVSNPRFKSTSEISRRINSFLKYFNSEKRSSVQVSFYGGNFLGLSKQVIQSALRAVTTFIQEGQVDSIRFSTRPDTVNADSLFTISTYAVKTVELGVQSMDDEVLKTSRRGHNSSDVIYAVKMLKDVGYDIGIQMMLGLPGDNEEKVVRTANKIIELSPDFVRIYPTVVMRNSLLFTMYSNGDYVPLCLDECTSLTKKIFLLFKKQGISVIRMGLQASIGLDKEEKIVAGPYHPAFGHMVYSELFFDAIKATISEMCYKPEFITIGVHPKNISKVQGLRKMNIKSIKAEFNLSSVKINQQHDISKRHLNICGKLVKVY